MLKIPFYKPSLGAEELNEVLDTLRGGWITTGARTKQFEREFGQYVSRTHAVAVNSCTAALHLALEAAGIQSGDGVLVPTMTFAATAEVGPSAATRLISSASSPTATANYSRPWGSETEDG